MPIQLTYTFETDAELRSHLGISAATPVAAPAPATPAPTSTTDDDSDGDGASDATPTRDDVDGDGMPYDPEVHSDPPTFTAKGLWRSRKGRADEANAAREAFKAGGGGETPPDTSDRTETPAAPAATEAPAELQLPGGSALPAPAAPPVSFDDVANRMVAAMSEGKLAPGEQLVSFYRQHLGAVGDTPADVHASATQILKNNETMRRSLMTALATL